MTSSQEIAKLSETVLLKNAVEQHKELLNSFHGLPKVLKQKITQLHKSALPSKQCADCERKFYTLSDINNEQGYLCVPCIEYFAEEYP